MIAGNAGAAVGGQGTEEVVLAISHQVLDVVSTARRTQTDHRRLRASPSKNYFNFEQSLSFHNSGQKRVAVIVR